MSQLYGIARHPKITDAGMKWALENAATSLVARVALNGNGWPESYRATAIEACNAKAVSR